MEPILPVKQPITVDIMLNFDGDGSGIGMCKQPLSVQVGSQYKLWRACRLLKETGLVYGVFTLSEIENDFCSETDEMEITIILIWIVLIQKKKYV